MKKIGFLTIILLLVPITFGCGSGKVQLSGTVTYSDTGEPLEAGTVAFQTEKFFARGTLGTDGKYVVSSISANDGMLPGKYRVYISGAHRQIGETAEGTPIMEPLIEAKYELPETSGMTLEVDKNTKTFDIQVDRCLNPKPFKH